MIVNSSSRYLKKELVNEHMMYRIIKMNKIIKFQFSTKIPSYPNYCLLSIKVFIKITFNVALQFLFNVVIIFITFFYLKFNFIQKSY